MDSPQPGRIAPRPAGRATGLPDDTTLLAGLRAGDEEIFSRLVDAWAPTMLKLARGYVHSHESAADVVQETWLAVLRGAGGFEGRSSLKTWVFRILSNIAKTTGTRESRVVVRALIGEDAVGTIPPHRFRGADDDYPGHWRTPPAPWPDLTTPESELLRSELRLTIAAAIRSLPARQRLVVTMRDIEGFAADEVCELMGLSPANQRVILHRGRAAVRTLLENHFGTASQWRAAT
ncbi:MAG: sigma-70 family RNA polymerase sigma factor [Nocardioidaceae bacterium]